MTPYSEGPGPDVTAPAARTIEFERMFNIRRLDGLPTTDGRSIRPGRLIRSDDPHLSTPADRTKLAASSIDTVIDLRITEEIELRGTDAWNELGVRRVSAPWWTHIPPMEEQHRYLIPESAAELYVEMHLTGLANQTETWTAMAEASDGLTLIHCASGRDRTGILVAILLTALGVPRPAILADYSHSGVGMGRMLDYLTGTVTGEELEALNLDREAAIYTPEQTIAGFLDRFDEHHGGVDRYFAEIGRRDELAVLRSNLLTG